MVANSVVVNSTTQAQLYTPASGSFLAPIVGIATMTTDDVITIRFAVKITSRVVASTDISGAVQLVYLSTPTVDAKVTEFSEVFNYTIGKQHITTHNNT